MAMKSSQQTTVSAVFIVLLSFVLFIFSSYSEQQSGFSSLTGFPVVGNK